MLLIGDLQDFESLSALKQKAEQTSKPIFFAVPFCAIGEKGIEAHGEEPILGLVIEDEQAIDLEAFTKTYQSYSLDLNDVITASPNDQTFRDMVEQVRKNHILGGDATQIVLSRAFEGCFETLCLEDLFWLFQALCHTGGQYQTLLLADQRADNRHDHHYLLAASPECHIYIDERNITMTPIAGTFRKDEKDKPNESDDEKLARLKTFLQDEKEINELFQVVDEEVKMMGALCPEGGKITGPYLREIGAVIHTEYKLEGQRPRAKDFSAIDGLRQTMHAPTLVGGPLESAARQIKAYETKSRSYYGGEIGLYEPATKSRPDRLDCSIFIRGIEIKGNGEFEIRAGAGIVRDSDPISEELETRAKAGALLSLISQGQTKDFKPFLTQEREQNLKAVLERRNQALSHFWIEQQNPIKPSDLLRGLPVTIINNEDDFAFMLAHILSFQGCDVRVVDCLDFDPDQDKARLVILGPGPGDINDEASPRMRHLNVITNALLDQKRLMMGVCLGHQALAKAHDIDVVLQDTNTQGVARQVSVFGRHYNLGFYNSFSPVNKGEPIYGLDMDCDEDNRILVLKGGHFISFQFHPESILSEKGHEILTQSLIELRLTRMR